MNSVWANVRTIGIVTLVTLLIWVWADAETQRDDLLRPISPGTSTVEEAEFTVETLPVMVAMPAAGGKAQWERARPEAAELKHITITGPRAVIDRIKAGDKTLRLAALLVIDEQDLRANLVSKGVELTPGGLGLRFAGPAPTVRVTIAQ